MRKRHGKTVALDGVSFEVAARRMFGFVGPDGAGTTTLRLAAIVVVIFLAARIYDRSVLRFGTAVTLREALTGALRRGWPP